jgi:hypothetical protein
VGGALRECVRVQMRSQAFGALIGTGTGTGVGVGGVGGVGTGGTAGTGTGTGTGTGSAGTAGTGTGTGTAVVCIGGMHTAGNFRPSPSPDTNFTLIVEGRLQADEERIYQSASVSFQYLESVQRYFATSAWRGALKLPSDWQEKC